MNTTRRQKDDLNFWNIIFSIFFFIALIGTLCIMYMLRGGFLVSVPPFDAILMSFAAFRITRLIVYDKISRWFRELFADTREFTEGGVTYVEIKPFGSGFRHTVHDLLSCPWCIGFWSSLVIMFCYFIFPWAWSVIFFLAVAGAGSLLQLWANVIGWRAENLKIDAQAKEASLGLPIDRTSVGN